MLQPELNRLGIHLHAQGAVVWTKENYLSCFLPLLHAPSGSSGGSGGSSGSSSSGSRAYDFHLEIYAGSIITKLHHWEYHQFNERTYTHEMLDLFTVPVWQLVQELCIQTDDSSLSYVAPHVERWKRVYTTGYGFAQWYAAKLAHVVYSLPHNFQELWSLRFAFAQSGNIYLVNNTYPDVEDAGFENIEQIIDALCREHPERTPPQLVLARRQRMLAALGSG